MSADAAYLAFETGGTKLVAGLAGSDGRLRKTTAIRRGPSDRGPRSFARIVAAAEQMLSESLGADELRSIGFGFGGTVRRSANSPHLCLHEDGWEEVNVAAELEGRFRVPVVVENDCKLAALAEAHFGAGVGARSVFYVTLGTGVGGGYVLEGRICPFGDLGEAEIGHIVVDEDGPECCCGNKGCVEALCSGPGLTKLFALLAGRSHESWKSSALFSEAGPEGISSVQVIRAWESGDEFASEVMSYSAKRLASALGAVINLLVPQRIVVGGGLGTATPRLLELIRQHTEGYVVPYFRDSYSIVASRLRESVVTQGAAILACQVTSA